MEAKYDLTVVDKDIIGKNKSIIVNCQDYKGLPKEIRFIRCAANYFANINIFIERFFDNPYICNNL